MKYSEGPAERRWRERGERGARETARLMRDLEKAARVVAPAANAMARGMVDSALHGGRKGPSPRDG